MIVVCESSFLLQLGITCNGPGQRLYPAVPTDVSELNSVFVSAIAMGDVSSSACL